MTTHTPGPWLIEYDNWGNGGFSEWFNVGPVKIYFDGNELDQAEADARLCAAAPDMLAALKALIAWDDMDPSLIHAFDLGAAAIVKATKA